MTNGYSSRPTVSEPAPIDLPVQSSLEFLRSSPSDHHGGETVAGDVRERPALAHELVDAKYDRPCRERIPVVPRRALRLRGSQTTPIAGLGKARFYHKERHR